MYRNIHNEHRQGGLSLISGLLLLVVVGFLALVAVRLFPVYFDYFTVSSVLNEVRNTAHGESPSAIRDTIERRFEVNEVDAVSAGDIRILPDNGGMNVSIRYEQRVPFIANLSLIASFSKSVEVPAH